MIGDEVTVTVLEVKGGQVRLGIAAPKRIEVHRKEVYLRNKAAAAVHRNEGAPERGGPSEAAA